MATVTRVLAIHGRVSGEVRFEVDYDNVSLILQTARVVNGSAEPATLTLTKPGGASVSRTYPAKATTPQALPQQPGQRITITVLDGGRWDGVKIGCR